MLMIAPSLHFVFGLDFCYLFFFCNVFKDINIPCFDASLSGNRLWLLLMLLHPASMLAIRPLMISKLGSKLLNIQPESLQNQLVSLQQRHYSYVSCFL